MGNGLSEGYGVLKGRAIAGEMEFKTQSPHYQVHVKDNSASYRLAVNVRSVEQPYDLLYWLDPDFKHPITAKLEPLAFGFTAIEKGDRQPGGIALDYIRANLFDIAQMTPLPFNVSGGSTQAPNDLNELLDLYIQRAVRSEDAVIYAFGEPWGPEPEPDKVFHFQPGRGVHNLHMNQGSPKPDPGSGKRDFSKENGVWQDGGLLIHFPSSPQPWVAVFFKFASQASHTHDQSGDVLGDIVDTKAKVKIVAALANPAGDDVGKESVTLINRSSETVNLDGWAIADGLKRKHQLIGVTVAAGDVVTVKLSGRDAQLSNQGGMITLLDAQGTKVDGVSYTKAEIADQGWTLVF
ncbi:MAG: DUF2278 family protein [Oculatellaceae cyanobacterium bins.114]|nr:DUF2278 family protein [Oculatellaceae cyanobacterium bins.114]